MKTALFSVSYAGLWGQHRLELAAFIERAKALGYEGVMLMAKRPHLSVLDFELRWCAEVARPFGVALGIQNHHDLGVDTDALLEMLRDIDQPNVKLMFDAWSPALRGEDLYQAAKKAAPHMVATTCADYVRLPRYAYVADAVNYRAVEPDLVRAVPMGDGFIDYPAFFRGLRDGGFDGWVNYEMCSPLRGGGSEQNLDAHAGRFLDYFKNHLSR